MPVFILGFGLTGVFILYGWRSGLLESPGAKIDWEQVQVMKKMKAVKNLRIDEVINYLETSNQSEQSEYSMNMESMVGQERSNRTSVVFKDGKQGKKESSSRRGSDRNIKIGKGEIEDDTRRLIENHFKDRPMNMIVDKEKGEILIIYKGVNKEPTFWDVIFCKQMIYLYLSFCCSSVTPIFFLNKLNRMVLTYLYTDSYVGPALISMALLSCVMLLLNILLLHKVKSKKFMITNYTVINYILVLNISYLSNSLLGMIIMASTAIFTFVYLQALMAYLVSIAVNKNVMTTYLYPFLYSSLVVGNLIKVFFIEPNSDTFQAMVFAFLVVQGLGFLFISGVNIKKLRQHCINYISHQEKLKKNM